MRVGRKAFVKKKYTYLAVSLAFLLICTLIGFPCFQYYRQVQKTIKTESNGYMLEISTQMSNSVSKTIDDNFFALERIASILQSSKVTSYLQLRTSVLEQQGYWKYRELLVIDEHGVAYDEKGNSVALANDTYLQEVIMEEKSSMSASQVIDGKECIIFAIPLENIEINHIKMSGLAVIYDLSTFDKILSMSAFDGKGYAHIIRKDGTVVVRSSSENALQTGYNLLNSLSSAQILDGRTLEDIKNDIASNEVGQIEFKMNDMREYLTYVPLTSHDWFLLTFVPVTVVNAKSNLLLKITLLLCSFIVLSFSGLLAFLMGYSYSNKKKLERIAYVDPVTGGDTIQHFYKLAQNKLEASGRPLYALTYLNIEKFKVLNEQFGRKACDKILCSIVYGIGSDLNSKECMGRLFADNFCVLIELKEEISFTERFSNWYKACARYVEESGTPWLPLVMEFGIYVIENNSMPLPQMIDRAKLALTETTYEIHGKLRCGVYDDTIRHQLFYEKQLEDRMEWALNNREFQVYLQPKYHLPEESIGGAEALVRWISAEKGMIYPDEFIPLFEKNGFIIQLDLWVLEEVCRTIRQWLDAGKTPVKISVNCSRVHFKNMNFLQEYCSIVEKYAILPQWIEIELTESAVFEDVGKLTYIIEQIHSAGFGCSMDDFGSGYSSLNLIKDIPVDTLKLDKIFFRSKGQDMQRTESVVGSIITMSKALSMETVAEGIEERSQVTMLKRLDCDYIQGYFFAKPMTITEFELLAFPQTIKN